MTRNPFIFCIFALALAGCTLAPRNTGNAYMFALAPVTAAPPATASPLRLGVGFPVAAPELDTSRIALKRADGNWDYYAGAKWADFLPVMLQDNIAKSIENTRIFRSVAVNAGPSADLVLKIEIREFEADYRRSPETPVIRVHLALTLLDHQTAHALASFGAEAHATAARDSLPAIQAAFQNAFTAAEKQAVLALSRQVPALSAQ